MFATIGGMGPSATAVLRSLASLLVEKWNVNYSKYLLGCDAECAFPWQDLLQDIHLHLHLYHAMLIWPAPRVACQAL